MTHSIALLSSVISINCHYIMFHLFLLSASFMLNISFPEIPTDDAYKELYCVVFTSCQLFTLTVIQFLNVLPVFVSITTLTPSIENN